MPPTGLLLVNLGTPDAPDTASVRRYLREFLSDPRVIDLPAIPRWLLLNLVILPTRPAKSAHAYRQIWTDAGSPLLVHSRALAAEVAAKLGPQWCVELAMRYGRPSVAHGLDALGKAGVGRIVVLPLFPQYASATTGSALEKVLGELGTRVNVPSHTTVAPFFDRPAFLDAFAARGRPVLEELRPDHVLFSFHGLPERQVLRADESRSHCLKSESCCARIGDANRNCYRAQCFATARGIAERCGLADGAWSVTFQSRLGRAKWIEPHTDATVAGLAARGVKRIAMFSPAFVADCLETLEELALRTRDAFRAAGGEELRLVPSLNSGADWVACVADLAREQGDPRRA